MRVLSQFLHYSGYECYLYCVMYGISNHVQYIHLPMHIFLAEPWLTSLCSFWPASFYHWQTLIQVLKHLRTLKFNSGLLTRFKVGMVWAQKQSWPCFQKKDSCSNYSGCSSGWMGPTGNPSPFPLPPHQQCGHCFGGEIIHTNTSEHRWLHNI